uniref:Exocrine gland-secreting peptide 9 n=1 Tax=Mus musculus TaxID=10090 RepID=A8R0U2_MOUSE|nr:exocrine gland-secreting peptide 9 [Mus musculus]
MTSFPVMLFLIIVLLPSMCSEGMVLTYSLKETTISADKETTHNTVVRETDYQHERNNKEALEKTLGASHSRANIV